jgi:deoxyribodipyrimidine photo-lyase
MPTTLLWLRQDLRLTDHPALCAAVEEGGVVPVFILDDALAGSWAMGGAQRWWLHHSLSALRRSLEKRGSRLVLRRGDTATILAALTRETGAKRIHAIRHYEPWNQAAERAVAKVADLDLHDGNHLVRPEHVLNASGGRYRVFTPWYRAMTEAIAPLHPLAAPSRIAAPEPMPESDALDDWALLPRTPDWAGGFAEWGPGEKGAWRRWRSFADVLDRYGHDRDFPALEATSRLSPHLHFGEISPRSLWSMLADRTGAGPATFRSELAWREHGINLLDQMPDYPERNGREGFERLGWREDDEADRDFRAWTRGRTGYPVVDAGMRQLWQTGWMHNRMRMVTASFLVKHLLIDWRRGERWFWDTLVDADLGSNAMNWQYVAGTGVDAPVFSRIMAPYLQSEKFDMADYVRQFVPELRGLDDARIHALHLKGDPPPGYPGRLVGHAAARERALSAWQGTISP